jgi:two-component system CheB/CheR fusion protein
MKILFADDQYDTINLYRWALEGYGHSVRTAIDAYEAIQAVREEEFDIMVIDVEMPGMSGWEAVHHIRRLPFGQNVPIAIYTAYYSAQHLDKAHEAGASTLLTKPMMPNDLNRSLLDMHHAFHQERGSASG